MGVQTHIVLVLSVNYDPWDACQPMGCQAADHHSDIYNSTPQIQACEKGVGPQRHVFRDISPGLETMETWPDPPHSRRYTG